MNSQRKIRSKPDSIVTPLHTATLLTLLVFAIACRSRNDLDREVAQQENTTGASTAAAKNEDVLTDEFAEREQQSGANVRDSEKNTTDAVTASAGDFQSESTSRQQTPADPKASYPYRFVDRAKELGATFTYRNGESSGNFAMPENLGGGVALVDLNRDGGLDLVAVGGGGIDKPSLHGLPLGIFYHRGGKFVEASIASRIREMPMYSHGIAAADFDNDGWQDLVITGYGAVECYCNQGDGTFTRAVSPALSKFDRWATSAAAGDFNGDGNLDLYVASYVDWSFENHPYCPAPPPHGRELCSPKEFSGQEDVLFLSDTMGGFLNSTRTAGLNTGGKGLGVLVLDVDSDFDADIYVANDTTDNFLYINNGNAEFEDVALLSGVAVDERALPNGSMGLTAVDVDRDLAVDIWVTNYERESFALYRNEGLNTFLHTSRNYGMSALGGMYVGFGTDWEDFDLDGREEIVITNGHVLKFPVNTPRRQIPLLLSWDEDRFRKVDFPGSSYFSGTYEGRGLAVGDLNRDGKSDIVVSHINEPLAVLINECDARGRSIRATLTGVSSNRDAIGARVVLRTKKSQLLHHVVGGGSYLSHNDREFQFVVPSGDIPQKLTVYWPSGIAQELEIPSGERWNLLEPSKP